MTTERHVIVNADDFGLSPGVNRGIVAAHEHGIVTSASLMVRWPAATQAAADAAVHPTLSVGLHVDLGEWVYRDGDWEPLYLVVDRRDGEAVHAEAVRQVARFRRLLGRDPTHLDSHQHVHRDEPVRAVLAELGRELGVPVRQLSPGVRHCGEFYGQDVKGRSYPELVTSDGLIGVLTRLSAGLTEMSCHPGERDDLDTMYVRERAAELAALCDPRVRAAVRELGIELISFRDPRVASAQEVLR
jgi:predicted glycoside hydrolase/deacetylase ChbG (UPF0249 family)